MSETHLSCDTVGHELWLAILSSLLCPETDKTVTFASEGKVMCLFCLILRSGVLMFHQLVCKQLF